MIPASTGRRGTRLALAAAVVLLAAGVWLWLANRVAPTDPVQPDDHIVFVPDPLAIPDLAGRSLLAIGEVSTGPIRQAVDGVDQDATTALSNLLSYLPAHPLPQSGSPQQ